MLTAGAVWAGECKFCGSKTDDVYVYRCNKCKTFFCDNCRDGDKDKVVGGNDYMQALASLSNQMRTEYKIICPECGESDVLSRRAIDFGMKKNKIRLIHSSN